VSVDRVPSDIQRNIDIRGVDGLVLCDRSVALLDGLGRLHVHVRIHRKGQRTEKTHRHLRLYEAIRLQHSSQIHQFYGT